MNIRIAPEDVWFSRCVRERAGNRCEKCGRTAEQGRIDCSHFFSRRHNATRWEPLNAFAHCFQCHQYLGTNPVEFVAWVEAKIGPAKVQWLRDRHAMTLKLSKIDRAFIAAHYKAEHQRMLAERKAGRGGYLQFAGWGAVPERIGGVA